MMRWVAVTWLGLVCALAVGGVAAAQGPTNVKAMIAGLEDGTIRGSNVAHASLSVQWGRAVGIVDAPMADVLAVVENYAGYYTFMPHFRTSKVLSQRGASALVYMQASIAANTMNLWAQMKVGPRPNEGDTRVIEGKMVDGNMDAMMARWEVTPIDANRTLVAFQLLMDPKLPLPDSFVSSENEIATRKTIRALRQVLAERKQKQTPPAKH
ncbi:MAG TPA: SRPBCC family protein [Polyangiales bacterium]|nr:SRPBCC family protein [Polyangiales bacterium]